MNSNDNLCGVDKRYEGIDGLKAYAILGIALMHVLANGGYELGGFVFGRMIPAFTNLVFLFMMVSGFWYVLRLLPENCRPKDQHGKILQQKIHQNLAVLRIALCAGFCDFTEQKFAV